MNAFMVLACVALVIAIMCAVVFDKEPIGDDIPELQNRVDVLKTALIEAQAGRVVYVCDIDKKTIYGISSEHPIAEPCGKENAIRVNPINRSPER